MENEKVIYGVEQSNHGHIYRWLFYDDQLEKELREYEYLGENETLEEFLEDSEYQDIGYPVGGSNSSSTLFKKFTTKESALMFLRSKVEVDYDDPTLVDLAEGFCTIEYDRGCANEFVNSEEAYTKRYDPRYDIAKEYLEKLSYSGSIDTSSCNCIPAVFYADNFRDMRFSELCELEEVRAKGKTITVSEKLKENIFDFCIDECNYHINESGCAEEYHNEIVSQIELLKLLGYKDEAEKFKNEYTDYLEKHFEHIEEYLSKDTHYSELFKYCEKELIPLNRYVGKNNDDYEYERD